MNSEAAERGESDANSVASPSTATRGGNMVTEGSGRSECAREAKGAPSMLKLICRTVALARMLPT